LLDLLLDDAADFVRSNGNAHLSVVNC